MSPIPTLSLGSLRVGRMGANQKLGPLGVPFLGYLKGVLSELQPTPSPNLNGAPGLFRRTVL